MGTYWGLNGMIIPDFGFTWKYHWDRVGIEWGIRSEFMGMETNPLVMTNTLKPWPTWR